MTSSKMRKLLRLREMREQLSLGAVAITRREVELRKQAKKTARARFQAARLRLPEDKRAALRSGEEVRDPVARFTGIAVGLQRSRDRVEDRLEQVTECGARVCEARATNKSAREAFVAHSLGLRRMEQLSNRLTKQDAARADRAEEDAVAELFASRSRGLSDVR